MIYIIIAGIAYLLGTAPTALLIVRILTGTDVRAGGSHNIGAMNTFRTVYRLRHSRLLATVAFIVVWIGDMTKAMFAVVIARRIGMDPVLATTTATFFVILGHNYPFYLQFKGGRGAASLMGVMLMFRPDLFLLWVCIIFIFMIGFEALFQSFQGKRVSVFHSVSEQIIGRLVGEVIAVLPFYIFDRALFWPVLAGTVLVIYKHKPRLLAQLKKLQKTS